MKAPSKARPNSSYVAQSAAGAGLLFICGVHTVFRQRSMSWDPGFVQLVLMLFQRTCPGFQDGVYRLRSRTSGIDVSGNHGLSNDVTVRREGVNGGNDVTMIISYTLWWSQRHDGTLDGTRARARGRSDHVRYVDQR